MMDKNRNQTNGEKEGRDRGNPKGMPLSDRVARNTIVLTISRVLSIGLRFVALFIAFGTIVETDMAIYTILGSLVSLTSIITIVGSGGITLCLPSYVADYHAKGNTNEIGNLLSMTLLLTGGFGVISFLASLGAGLIIVPMTSDLTLTSAQFELLLDSTLIASIGTFLTGVMDGYQKTIVGIQRQDIYIVVTLFASIITAVGKIIFVTLGLSIIGLMIADHAFPLIGLFILRRGLYQRLPGLKLSRTNLPWQRFKHIAFQGLAIQVSDVGRMVTTSGIPILLQFVFPIWFGTPSIYQLYYSIILKLSTLSIEVGAQVGSPLMTGAAALNARQKKQQLQELVIRAFKFGVFLSASIAAGLSIIGRHFLLTYATYPVLLDFAWAFRILLFAQVLRIISLIGESALIGVRRAQLNSITSSIQAVAILLGAIGLQGVLPIEGVAIAIFLGYALTSLLIFTITLQQIGLRGKNFMNPLTKIGIATITPAPILYLVNQLGLHITIVKIVFPEVILGSTLTKLALLGSDVVLVLFYVLLAFGVFVLIKGIDTKDWRVFTRSIQSLKYSMVKRLPTRK